MKILIVVATNAEIERERFTNCELLITGVGMLNTAISLTQQLSHNNYDLIINMGVAGSFLDDFKIGDVVEVVEDTFSELGYEDDEGFNVFTEFDLKNTFTNQAKTKLPKASSITVNTVHGHEESITSITERLQPDIESMEGGAVFQVCEEFNVPCMQIRAISNKVEKRDKNNWNIPFAIRNLNAAVEKIMNTL